jgi:C-terminal processing protease CtpA/Prc
MTSARYLKADGSPIHEQGLRPDVPAERTLVAFDEPPPATDEILAAGVAELKRLREGPGAPSAASGG